MTSQDARSQPPPAPGARAGEEEFKPMDGATGWGATLQHILRTPGKLIYELHQPASGGLLLRLLGIALLTFAIYGVIVGLFSGDRQLWAAPLKVVAGAFLSALICLPSLYIFACLCGADVRLQEVAGLLLGLLALTGILLLGFAPAAWVFTVSTDSIGFMAFLHLVFWVIGTSFGLRFLNKGFHFLGGSRMENLVLWCIIFGLVTLQMTTTLRPILGTADTLLPAQKMFFLHHWGNVLSHGK